MKEYTYFEHISPGEMFSIENDDGSMNLCYKVLIGEYHACLILNNNDFKIEFSCPKMLVII